MPKKVSISFETFSCQTKILNFGHFLFRILEILQNIAQNIIETQVLIQIENKILLLISYYIACSTEVSHSLPKKIRNLGQTSKTEYLNPTNKQFLTTPQICVRVKLGK